MGSFLFFPVRLTPIKSDEVRTKADPTEFWECPFLGFGKESQGSWCIPLKSRNQFLKEPGTSEGRTCGCGEKGDHY